MKYTKGEWIYKKYSGDDIGVYSATGSGYDIALVRSGGHNDDVEANAQLISAAPDMYEVLKAVYAEIAHLPTERFLLLGGTEIEKALAKVEGK